MADQYNGQHAGDGNAAAEGQVNLQKAQYGSQRDHNGAFGQFAGQVFIHGLPPFLIRRT